MKIGGDANSLIGGGNAGGGAGLELPTAIKQNNTQGGPGLGSGNILNFDSPALNGGGVQFGDKQALVRNGNEGNSPSTGSENIITQLLSAILELLKSSEANSEKKGADASGSGNGSAGSQETSGSGDIMTQLMEMIKKLLGQSPEGAQAPGQGGAEGAQGTGKNSQQEQDGGGLAAKLGAALQMLGLGTLLSALSGGAGAQGGGEGK